MAGEWRSARIEEVAEKVAIGPFGSRMKSDRYVSSGVPVIRGNNISDTRTLVGDFAYVSAETADELRSSNVFPGDLVFPHRGAIGEVGIVPGGVVDRYILSTSLMELTCNPNLADPLFLFYFFRSRRGRHELLKHASTVGTPGIGQPLTSLKSILVPLPPLTEQRAIAEILGALDDKIDLNRRMNETLEAIARAVFKSWFVDFDPVRAKMEGRQPYGMDAATAALFPDAFEDSPLGKIPKGWKVVDLSEIVDVIDCLHSKKPARQPEGKPFLQLSNIRDDGLLDMSDTYHITADDYSLWVSRIEASPGDCVITNVGRSGAVAQIPEGFKAALGRNMTAIRCKPSWRFPTFVLQALLSDAMQSEIQLKLDSGTILDALNVRNIPKLRLALPPDGTAAKFERFVRPVRAMMELIYVRTGP